MKRDTINSAYATKVEKMEREEERLYLGNLIVYFYKVSYSLGVTPVKVVVYNNPQKNPRYQLARCKSQTVICGLMTVLCVLNALSNFREILGTLPGKGVQMYLTSFCASHRFLGALGFVINNWFNHSELEDLLNLMLTRSSLPIKRLQIGQPQILKVMFSLLVVLIAQAVVLEIVVPLSTFTTGIKFVESGRFMFWLAPNEVHGWNDLTAFDFIILGIAIVARFARFSGELLLKAYCLVMAVTLWSVASAFASDLQSRSSKSEMKDSSDESDEDDTLTRKQVSQVEEKLILKMSKIANQNRENRETKRPDLKHIVEMYFSVERFSGTLNAAMGSTVFFYVMEGIVWLPLTIPKFWMTKNWTELSFNIGLLVMLGAFLYTASEIFEKMQVTEEWLNKTSTKTNLGTTDFVVIFNAVTNKSVGIKPNKGYTLTPGFVFIFFFIVVILLPLCIPTPTDL